MEANLTPLQRTAGERKCAMNRLDREQVSTDIYDFLSREASPDVQVNNDTKCALWKIKLQQHIFTHFYLHNTTNIY